MFDKNVADMGIVEILTLHKSSHARNTLSRLMQYSINFFFTMKLASNIECSNFKITSHSLFKICEFVS